MQRVFDIAHDIYTNSTIRHVSIDTTRIPEIASQTKHNAPVMRDITIEDVAIELVASSINYCFWYGSDKFKPINSVDLYGIIEHAINKDSDMLDIIKLELIRASVPLLEERFNHLNQLYPIDHHSLRVLYLLMNKDVNAVSEYIMTSAPGFASDIFRKRLSLFFIQMYRRTGHNESFLANLPVPADYQVPKILRDLGILKYSDELSKIIDMSVVIPKHSLMEVQIRAATILACQYIKNHTDANISEVDYYLWSQRKNSRSKHHLTYTTDY